MKNIYEVMRQKEQEIARLEKEIEALRVAAPLLVDEHDLDTANNMTAAAAIASGPQPIRIAQPAAVNANPQPVQTAKRWP